MIVKVHGHIGHWHDPLHPLDKCFDPEAAEAGCYKISKKCRLSQLAATRERWDSLGRTITKVSIL